MIIGERGTPLLDLFDNVNFQDFFSWEQFIPIKGRCMPSSCFEPQALTPSKAHLHSDAPTFLCKGSYIISSVNPTSPQLQMGISCMTPAYYMFNNFSSEAPLVFVYLPHCFCLQNVWQNPSCPCRKHKQILQ